MFASVSTFQNLVQAAIAPRAPNDTKITETKRDTNTEVLDNINSIFATIYDLADGSIPLPPTSLERRTSTFEVMKCFYDQLVKLLNGGSSLAKRDVDPDTAAITAQLYAWADGTLPIPSGDGVSEFTTEDAMRFAELLKDIVVLWRSESNRLEVNISERSIEMAQRTAIAFSDMHAKRFAVNKAELKFALHVLAAAIDAIADAI